MKEKARRSKAFFARHYLEEKAIIHFDMSAILRNSMHPKHERRIH
jgi:hypothetical protein